MKILIIHNAYQVRGGEDAVVDSERKMFEDRGHDVVFYSRSNDEINDLSGFQKIKFFLKEIFWSQKSYDDVKNLIQKEKPELVHIHNTFYMITPSVYKACYDLNIPVVQTLHNYRFLCPAGTFFRRGKICEECVSRGMLRAVVHKCFKNSFISSSILVLLIRQFVKKKLLQDMISRFIVPSMFTKNIFIKNGWDQKSVKVKPNFVEDRGVGTEKEDYAIFVGHLAKYKGIETLLKACKEIDFSLKIIGEGECLDELKESNQKNNIEFLGSQSFEEVIALMKKACFLVLPSECYETSSRVIIEAFSCGTSVLVSDMGAVGELVEEGEIGLHFYPGNSHDLLEKLKVFIGNKQKTLEMGKSAREVYEKKYTVRNNYKQLISIYSEVLERKDE